MEIHGHRALAVWSVLVLWAVAVTSSDTVSLNEDSTPVTANRVLRAVDGTRFKEPPPQRRFVDSSSTGLSLLGSLATPNVLGASLNDAAGVPVLEIPEDKPWEARMKDDEHPVNQTSSSGKEPTAIDVDREIAAMVKELRAQQSSAKKLKEKENSTEDGDKTEKIHDRMLNEQAKIKGNLDEKLQGIRRKEIEEKRKEKEAHPQQGGAVHEAAQEPAPIQMDSAGHLIQSSNDQMEQINKKGDGKFKGQSAWAARPKFETTPEVFRVASLPHVDLEPLVTLAVDGLRNSQEFMDWVKAKPHVDVATGERLRRKAYERLHQAREKAVDYEFEANTHAKRLQENARALGALSDSNVAAQSAQYSEMELQADAVITDWTNKLAQLRGLGASEGSEGIKWAQHKFELLNGHVAELERWFAETAGSINLASNSGAKTAEGLLAHKLWAKLYEAKDDVIRTLPLMFKAKAAVTVADSVYKDRVAQELRLRQVAKVMDRFPIQTENVVPVLVKGAEADVKVKTAVWAACRCPLEVNSAGAAVCSNCERELWPPSDVEKKWGAVEMQHQTSRRMLRWGAMPRENPILCLLDAAVSSDKGKCAYVCEWQNVYGATPITRQIKSQCSADGLRGLAMKECEQTYIYLATTQTSSCAQQLAPKTLWEHLSRKWTKKRGTMMKSASTTKRKLLSKVESQRDIQMKEEVQGAPKVSDGAREDKIWDFQSDPIYKQTPGYQGWNCIRVRGKGTKYGYECSLVDPALGFIGFRGAVRYRAAESGNAAEECVLFERTVTEDQSVCGCCPRFKCTGNCPETYDSARRGKFDAYHNRECNRKYKSDQEMAKCANTFPENKLIPNSNNLPADLSQKWTKRPLPLDRQFQIEYGDDWKQNDDLREWYCKTQWMYSTVDLNQLRQDPLRAQSVGQCSAEKTASCEKVFIEDYVLQTNPLKLGNIAVEYPSDKDPSKRALGVVWPKRYPPQSSWPSKALFPVEPSRHEFCLGCCQQVFPQKAGCPRRGMTKDNTAVPLNLPENAGETEWGDEAAAANTEYQARHPSNKQSLKEESAIALVQVSEGRPTTYEGTLEPGFAWATSPWAVRRRSLPERVTFRRRRRQFYNSDQERRLKASVLDADKDVSRTTAETNTLEREQRAMKKQRDQELRVAEMKNKDDYDTVPAEVKAAAVVKKLPQEEIDKLVKKSQSRVKKANQQRTAAVERKWELELAAGSKRLARSKLAKTTAAYNKKKSERIIKETEDKRYRKEHVFEQQAQAAFDDLSQQLLDANKRSRDRWEAVGVLREELGKAQKETQKAETEAENQKYKVLDVSVNMRDLINKISLGDKLSERDMSQMARQAADKVKNMVRESKQETAVALQDAFEDFVTNSQLVLKSSDGMRAAGSVEKVSERALQYFRDMWHKLDCSSRARGVYMKREIEQEAGYSDSKGTFFSVPQCMALDSYLGTCDRGLEKFCSTDRVDKVAHSGPYKCIKSEVLELSTLEKTIFCPRLAEGDGGKVACVTKKTCKGGKARDGTILNDCAMF